MKTIEQLITEGVQIVAVSSNGDGEVSSYNGKRNGRRIYGFYCHRENKYIEE